MKNWKNMIFLIFWVINYPYTMHSLSVWQWYLLLEILKFISIIHVFTTDNLNSKTYTVTQYSPGRVDEDKKFHSHKMRTKNLSPHLAPCTSLMGFYWIINWWVVY